MFYARVIGLPTVALTVVLLSVPAGAQQGGAGPEEIKVTARKREEDLQSVPVSITAFSSEDLELRDIISLEQLADQTAGLSFATTGNITGTRAVIRGVSQQTRVGDETNVATFIDGAYTPGFSGAEFFGFDSLERIEVIKGPQSAVYGRNSFAGAINYVSKKPTYEFEYGGRLVVGQADRQGITGFVAGPLIDSKLALRLDGGFDRTGGTNVNSVNNEPLSSADTKFARLGLLFEPFDSLKVGVRASLQEDFVNPTAATLIADDDPNRIGKRLIFTFSPFEFAAGGGGPIGRIYSGEINARSNTYTIDERSFAGDREIRRFAVDFDWDLGGVSLIGISSYQDRKVQTLGDFSTCRADVRAAVCDNVSPTAIGTFFGGPLANQPLITTVLTGSREDRDEFSQDLHLQSNGDGPLRWLAGVYYSTEDFTDQNQRLSDSTITNGDGSIIYAVANPNPVVDSTTLIKNEFYSIYGSVDYDFTDIFSMSVEGRWTREDKQADQVENNFPSTTPATGFADEAFTFFTPRIILTLTPNDNVLAYVSAAKGVKSGGFNAGSVDVPTFDQEENWTYELGTKLTLWDGKARINGAAYYIDWDDQQITATDPANSRLPITVNVAETEIKGIELEAFVNPYDWLQLNAGATVLDAEYKSGSTTSIEFFADCDALPIPCDLDTTLGPVTSGSVAGQKVVGTPDKTFNFGAQVNLPIGDGNLEFVGRADYSWQDKYFIDEANAGFIPQRKTLNLRVGIEDERWSLQGFCNNITSNKTPLFAIPPRDILGVPHFFVINRNARMCGAQVSFQG